jgi:glycosyltransferase involved in cell wall biosynthesis
MAVPALSVCIITYQHRPFIADAIEGALAQRTNFPVEILIGEDGSTDGTREICEDFASRYPNRIRLFLRRREDAVLIDGRPRGSFNLQMTIRAAAGEFVALCEGDDFWTDPTKLQRQVEFLQQNPQCSACFHDVQIKDVAGHVIESSYFNSDRTFFTQEDVLRDLMSRQPTCSMVFRRSAFVDPLPAWYLRRPSDFYLDLLLTGSGQLGFLRRNMGVYRRHPGGIWSSAREASRLVELIVRYKLLLAEGYFLHHHRDLILTKIDELESQLFTRADAAAEIERLHSIVNQQTLALNRRQIELDRLQALLSETAQQTQDCLAVNHTQGVYIATLEKERNHLQAIAAQAGRESQSYLGQIATQTTYISILEKERDRLQAAVDQASRENQHYLAVIDEQNRYIEILKNSVHPPDAR